MNTKTKNIVAILMATIIAMALITPTAMANDGTPITIDVPNEPPEVVCKCESPKPVTPNLDPADPVTVTVCALVCDKNGKGDISSVKATVYNPDGTVHDIVPMVKAETCECNLLEPVVSSTEPLCTRCDGPTCQLYKGTFQMDITQPGGEYRVVVTATDAGGLVDKLQNRFFFESLVIIDIDFTELIFKDIVICEPSYIDGDDVMEDPGPAPDVKPTIHNAGNDPIQIGFHYSFDQEVATIKMDVNGKWFEPCQVYWDDILEEYCDTMPLTFSLHVEEGTPGGLHTGYIEITAREAPHTVLLENKKTDDIDLYDPILSDGTYGELTYDLETCEFDFNGYGLTEGTEYCLIYYPEPWPGSGGCSLGKDTASSGEVTISGLFPTIPNAGDWSYDRAGEKLAKIWLVPCDDYTDGVGLNKWNPSEILFDMETIQCCPLLP